MTMAFKYQVSLYIVLCPYDVTILYIVCLVLPCMFIYVGIYVCLSNCGVVYILSSSVYCNVAVNTYFVICFGAETN